jgi:hypothetical protein
MSPPSQIRMRRGRGRLTGRARPILGLLSEGRVFMRCQRQQMRSASCHDHPIVCQPHGGEFAASIGLTWFELLNWRIDPCEVSGVP